jgi:hypothetical protein
MFRILFDFSQGNSKTRASSSVDVLCALLPSVSIRRSTFRIDSL